MNANNNAEMDDAEQITNNWTHIAGSSLNNTVLFRNPEDRGPKYALINRTGYMESDEVEGFVDEIILTPSVPTPEQLTEHLSYEISDVTAETLINEWAEWVDITLTDTLTIDNGLFRARGNRAVFEIVDCTPWLDGICDILGNELDEAARLQMEDGDVFENVKDDLAREVYYTMKNGRIGDMTADLAAEIEFVEYGDEN